MRAGGLDDRLLSGVLLTVVLVVLQPCTLIAVALSKKS